MAKETKATPGRGARIGLRLTVADRAAFEDAAGKANRTLSDWVVQVCRVAAKPARRGKGKE